MVKEKPDLSSYRDEIKEAEEEGKPDRVLHSRQAGPSEAKSELPERRARQKAMKHSSGTPQIVKEKPSEEKVFGREIKNVPTTLEQAMAIERESQSSNEVLGVLVEAHIKEADAILGRTFLRREDMAAVTDCLHLARQGIGGIYSKPMPWLAKWVVDKLRALPSIDGRSRTQFVEAWRDSMQERRRQEDQKNREKTQGFA